MTVTNARLETLEAKVEASTSRSLGKLGTLFSAQFAASTRGCWVSSNHPHFFLSQLGVAFLAPQATSSDHKATVIDFMAARITPEALEKMYSYFVDIVRSVH